jgi:ESF2/ABP1 family protein
VTPLTPHELEAFQRKQKKRGIVYISRIPPGMTPPKVRHLLSGYGEVERIYLQDGRKKEREAEAGRKLGKLIRA